MTWNGEERRSGKERRVVERRRTIRYNVHNLIVVNGVTWIDDESSERRHRIRRREDREQIARHIIQLSRP